MTPASLIQNYLLLHLGREFPGLDVWRANVVGRKPGVSVVAAGEPGQADLTGVWGGRCMACGGLIEWGKVGGVPGCARPLIGVAVDHLAMPSGRKIEIEIKSPGDSQSKLQRDFERRVTRLGALYIIARIRHKDTITELECYFRLSVKLQAACAHPAEIQAFFDELRARL